MKHRSDPRPPSTHITLPGSFRALDNIKEQEAAETFQDPDTTFRALDNIKEQEAGEQFQGPDTANHNTPCDNPDNDVVEPETEINGNVPDDKVAHDASVEDIAQDNVSLDLNPIGPVDGEENKESLELSGNPMKPAFKLGIYTARAPPHIKVISKNIPTLERQWRVNLNCTVCTD